MKQGAPNRALKLTKPGKSTGRRNSTQRWGGPIGSALTSLEMPEKNIRRYEHNYFYGWVVSIRRAGRQWVKYFSDRLGGRMAALRQAREHRGKLLAAIPRLTKIKRTYVLNTTGVVGVSRVKERTRADSIMVRYVASLPRRNARAGKGSFSVGLYGEAKARRFAIKARRQAVAEFLA